VTSTHHISAQGLPWACMGPMPMWLCGADVRWLAGGEGMRMVVSFLSRSPALHNMPKINYFISLPEFSSF
jgi:hypothetical protein